MDPPPAPNGRGDLMGSEYAVRVNEVKVNSVRDGAAWWHVWRDTVGKGRTCIERSVIPADVVHVHCDGPGHADALAEIIAARVPPSAVKVIRPDCGHTWNGLIAALERGQS